jgi:YgiT-type zinc finger domain-containing protein
MTDNSKLSPVAPLYYCPECQTGLMHLKHITYFTWLNEELITVPNFPAWVCDLCGRREYDHQAIIWLNTILHPEAGRKNNSKRKHSAITETKHPQKPLFPE